MEGNGPLTVEITSSSLRTAGGTMLSGWEADTAFGNVRTHVERL